VTTTPKPCKHPERGRWVEILARDYLGAKLVTSWCQECGAYRYADGLWTLPAREEQRLEEGKRKKAASA